MLIVLHISSEFSSKHYIPPFLCSRLQVNCLPSLQMLGWGGSQIFVPLLLQFCVKLHVCTCITLFTCNESATSVQLLNSNSSTSPIESTYLHALSLLYVGVLVMLYSFLVLCHCMLSGRIQGGYILIMFIMFICWTWRTSCSRIPPLFVVFVPHHNPVYTHHV